MNTWIQALKIWNKQNPTWCVPRKDTTEYNEVIKIKLKLQKGENIEEQKPMLSQSKPKTKVAKIYINDKEYLATTSQDETGKRYINPDTAIIYDVNTQKKLGTYYEIEKQTKPKKEINVSRININDNEFYIDRKTNIIYDIKTKKELGTLEQIQRKYLSKQKIGGVPYLVDMKTNVVYDKDTLKPFSENYKKMLRKYYDFMERYD